MFKGVRKFLIVLGLVISSSLFFVACESEKYDVETIAFKEDKIVMIVGQEYTPSVSVLPSYASNKGYHFDVMGNLDVLKIDGKVLTALKEGSVQLKVVADNNEYLEDVVTVSVLPNPLKLETPSSLRFDGELISFSPVENATSYNLYVNGTKIELSGKTSIDFDDLTAQFDDDLYNRVLSIKVGAVGDARITIPSDYSKEITVLKISKPQEFDLEDNIISFSKVAGVKEYGLKFLKNSQNVLTLNLNDSDFTGSVVKIDVKDYIDSFDGGEYSCELTCKKNNYESLATVEIFESDKLDKTFDVLGQPQNFRMSNNVLYWDSVVGADYYVIVNGSNNVIATNIKNTFYDMTEKLKNSNSYTKKVVACSNKKDVVSKIKYSSTVGYSVLSNPSVSVDIESGVLSWSEVVGAVAYNLVLTVGKNSTTQLVAGTQFDLNSLSAGDYTASVTAYGNGVDVLNAKGSADIEFSIQNPVANVEISNKVISWTADENAVVNLIVKDSNDVELKNEMLSTNSYDLSGYNFEAGQYTYSLKCVAKENALASAIVTKSFCKLADITDIQFAGGNLTFKTDIKTVSTGVECFKSGDSSNKIELSKIQMSKYSLDTSKILAGDYAIKVYAYGNNADIFDADNNDNQIDISKLASPNIVADTVNKTVKMSGEVATATAYELYQNGTKVADFDAANKSYSVASLTQGEYEFCSKSVGNGKNIVDSDISSVQVKVMRLDTPTITFNKNTKVFTINTNQKEYVASYNFSLGGTTLTATGGVVDCSTGYFAMAKNYEAKASLVAKTSDENYDLILNSTETSVIIQKINPSATLSLNSGKIYIAPTGFEWDKNVVAIKLGYKVSGEYRYVDVTDFVAKDGKYIIDAMDENYHPVGVAVGGNPVFDLSNEFKIKWIVSSADDNTIDSEEYVLGDITKRQAVDDLARDGQNIKFSAVAGASQYALSITTDSVYYISINTTSISIDKLVSEFAKQGLTIEKGTNYELKIVSIGDDADLVLSNWGENSLNFKILDEPNASVVLNSVQEKVLQIPCNVSGADKFKVVFKDSEEKTYTVDLACEGESVSYPLSNVEGLGEGDIDVKIKAASTTQNNFDSDEFGLSYNVLVRPTLSIENGMLVWSKDEDASSYLLSYNSVNWQTKTLTSADYQESDDKICYNLSDVISGFCQIKVQTISKLSNYQGYLFDSKASDVINVLKLSKPTYKVESGEVVFGIIGDQLEYVERATIVNKQTKEEIDITTLVEELSTEMTIAPEKLLQYLSVGRIDSEYFDIKLYAKNKGEEITLYLLNSEALTVEFKGLKPVENVQIMTTVDYDNDGETVDKVSWTNNSNNSGITKGYIVDIEFYKNGETEPIKFSKTIEGENINYLTFPTVEGFGVGDYKVRVKALASVSDVYLNSAYSEEYTFTLTAQPTQLKTIEGKVSWDIVSGAGSYLIRIYDSDDNYLECKKVSENSFDFNNLSGSYEAGLYKVSVQTINEANPNVVSSVESEKLTVLKIPEINSFKLEMGTLYIRTHKLVDRVSLVLTSGNVRLEYTGTIESDWESMSGASWDDYDIDALLADGMVDRKVVMKFASGQTTEIFDCLNDGYTISLCAIGNTSANFATVDSNVTNSVTGDTLFNGNEDLSTDLRRRLIKTKSPTSSVNTRGVVSWTLEDVTYSQMDYNGLKNILIYNVIISIKGQEHSFLVADNVDLNDLPNGTTYSTFGELELHTYDGYLRYDNGTPDDLMDDLYINVLKYVDTDNTQCGQLAIDFNISNLYYVKRSSTTDDKQMGSIGFTDGGNFDVVISVLGDNTLYLTSNNSKSQTIIRYQQLSLGIEDGYLKWTNLKTNIDSPVYLIKVTNTASKDVKYVYLYEESAGNDFSMPIYVEGATYKQTVSYDDEYIEFMLDTIFEDEYLFDESEYHIELTTYYRDSTSLLALQSTASSTFRTEKYKQIQLALNKGDLYWKQTQIPSTNKFVYDYEITIKYGEMTISYTISQIDYTIKDGYIRYTLPQSISWLEDVTTFIPGEDYEISVKAISTGNSAYVNSNSSNSIITHICDEVDNLQLVDNQLVWEYDTDGVFVVEMLYYDNESLVTYREEIEGKTFNLPDKIIDTSGQERKITANYLYGFRVKKVGGDSVLSSFYCSLLELQKLKTLDNATSNLGVLEWSNVTNLADEIVEGAKYEIVFEGEVFKDGEIVAGELLESNTFDFAGYLAGTIKFYMIVHHDSYFTSDKSSLYTFYKFDTVKDLKPEKDDNEVINTLTWSSISINGRYADKYHIQVMDVDSEEVRFEKVFEPTDKTASTMKFNISELGINITGMRVRVRAISSSEETDTINGEWSNYFALNKAEEIDQDKFVVNGLCIEWSQIPTEQDTDSYVLQYIYKSSSISLGVEETVTISSLDKDSYVVTDGTKVYSYKFYKIGTYSNIRMTVNRSGLMSSNPVVMTETKDGETVSVTYQFDLFNAGQGSAEAPYIITTASEFENINYYPTSYFKLGNDISLASKTGNIITNFGGTLDGAGYTISNWTGRSENRYLGLFEQTNQATIKNIVFAYLSGTMETSYISSAMYGGLIVGYAKDSTFTNITLDHSILNVAITDSSNNYQDDNDPNFYIGGFAGYLNNSKIEDFSITLVGQDENNPTASQIAIYGQVRDTLYFGGVAGYSYSSNILGSASKHSSISVRYSIVATFVKDKTTTYPSVYAGGVVAGFDTNVVTDGIKYVDVATNQVSHSLGGEMPTYNAGVCAYMKYGCISNVIVSGNIGANANSTTEKPIYLGKLVAKCTDDVLKYFTDNNTDNITLSYTAGGGVNIKEI